MTPTVSAVYSDLRLASPEVNVVTRKANPTPTKAITTIPNVGLLNHPVRLTNVITTAVEPPATATVMRRFFASPPRMPCQMPPASSATSRITHQGNAGDCRKLLNPMPTYCLRITATKNEGSEKNRNDRLVTV